MKEKFAGVTTDGESANTGSKSGLWKRLEEHVERKLMNSWCACHRSDLAMEDMEASVPELKAWKSNLLAIAEYYHRSGIRTKALKKILPTMKAFPSYHDVRFSQHLNNRFVLLFCTISLGACNIGRLFQLIESLKTEKGNVLKDT